MYYCLLITVLSKILVRFTRQAWRSLDTLYGFIRGLDKAEPVDKEGAGYLALRFKHGSYEPYRLASKPVKW